LMDIRRFSTNGTSRYRASEDLKKDWVPADGYREYSEVHRRGMTSSGKPNIISRG
jgi:hypothetical protein